MDCTICGKATLPGAKLCVPCKAALKRARYVTVQESIRRPSVIDARRARRARRADPVPIPESASRPRVSPDAVKSVHAGRRVLVLLLGVVALLTGAAYFGQREFGANAQSDGSAHATAVAVHPATAESLAKTATCSRALSGRRSSCGRARR
jgi:hypothetical protein